MGTLGICWPRLGLNDCLLAAGVEDGPLFVRPALVALAGEYELLPLTVPVKLVGPEFVLAVVVLVDGTLDAGVFPVPVVARPLTREKTKSPKACPEFLRRVYCGVWSERPATPG